MVVVVWSIVRRRSGAPKMIRLTARLTLTVLSATVMVLPAFAQAASETGALAKGDRLQMQPASCSKQVWPDFSSSCLRTAGAGGKILEARVIAIRH